MILDVEEERQLQRQQVQDGTGADIEDGDGSKALPSIFNGINLQRKLHNFMCWSSFNESRLAAF